MAGASNADLMPELTNDLWRVIIAHPDLDTADVLRLGLCSRQLNLLTLEEQLWQELSQRRLDRQCACYRLASANARTLADVFGGYSCRHMLQALCELGVCPVGLWWLCDQADGRHPGVELLSISVNGGLDCDTVATSSAPSETQRGLVALGLSYEPIDNADAPERGRPLFTLGVKPLSQPLPSRSLLCQQPPVVGLSLKDAAAEVGTTAAAAAAAPPAAADEAATSLGLSWQQRMRRWWSPSPDSAAAVGGGMAVHGPGEEEEEEADGVGEVFASTGGTGQGQRALAMWKLCPKPDLFRLMDSFDGAGHEGPTTRAALRVFFDGDGRRMVLEVQVPNNIGLSGAQTCSKFRLNYRRVEGMDLARPRSHGLFPPLRLDGGPDDVLHNAPPLVPEQPTPPPLVSEQPAPPPLLALPPSATAALPAAAPAVAAAETGPSEDSSATAVVGPSASATAEAVAGPSCPSSSQPSYHNGGGSEVTQRPPPPPPLPPSYLKAMLRSEGLWTAEYGSHGTELVQVRVAPAGSAPPAGLRDFFQGSSQESAESSSDSDGDQAGPAAPVPPAKPAWGESFLKGPRLECFKLVGDVNVPSGQFTFQADLSGVQRGGYDFHNLHTGELDHRLVLAFTDQGVHRVFLDRRPVAARLRGLGQINKEPGTWNPQWVRMELILYQDGGCLDEDWFSVLWMDQDTVYRHIIDFQPYTLPSLPSWMPPGADDAPEVDANGEAVVFDDVD